MFGEVHESLRRETVQQRQQQRRQNKNKLIRGGKGENGYRVIATK